MWIANDELPAKMNMKRGVSAMKNRMLKVAEGEAAVSETEQRSGEGTYMDSTEKELELTDKMESDSMDYESGLAEYTNHLSGKEAIWELAGNLAHVGSKYPLIVLTNDKNGILKEQDELKDKYPNIEIVELKDYLWPKCTLRFETVAHFQKLNILGMDRYDKLLWLDLDVRLRKSIDSSFELNTDSTTWFMKDEWYCNSTLANGGYSTGLMLFKPNKKLLEHTVAMSNKMGDCWGDQVIIQNAFHKKWTDDNGESKMMDMRWIPGKTIRYPQCDKMGDGRAAAIHFVKVKRGFVTPYAPEAHDKTDM